MSDQQDGKRPMIQDCHGNRYTRLDWVAIQRQNAEESMRSALQSTRYSGKFSTHTDVLSEAFADAIQDQVLADLYEGLTDYQLHVYWTLMERWYMTFDVQYYLDHPKERPTKEEIQEIGSWLESQGRRLGIKAPWEKDEAVK